MGLPGAFLKKEIAFGICILFPSHLLLLASNVDMMAGALEAIMNNEVILSQCKRWRIINIKIHPLWPGICHYQFWSAYLRTSFMLEKNNFLIFCKLLFFRSLMLFLDDTAHFAEHVFCEPSQPSSGYIGPMQKRYSKYHWILVEDEVYFFSANATLLSLETF